MRILGTLHDKIFVIDPQAENMAEKNFCLNVITICKKKLFQAKITTTFIRSNTLFISRICCQYRTSVRCSWLHLRWSMMGTAV